MIVETVPEKRRTATRKDRFVPGLARLRFEDEPLRAELLSLDQLRHHALRLAERHTLASRPRGDRLLRRFNENARILEETHRQLSRAAAEGRDIPPAGVWLLDNYYLIQDQIRMARHHLPRKYSMELPQLSGGASEGLPRVYDLALELITHVDGQIDRDSLHLFVGAYQAAVSLRIGELWAIPIMLRLALIENLRRVAVGVAWQQHDLASGQAWAERLTAASRRSLDDFLREVAELVSHPPILSSTFVARFAQGLRGRMSEDNIAVQWLNHHLGERGQTIEGLVAVDSQNQAADRISMSNCITSLRALGALDWKEFIEGQSTVEAILRQDPAGVYARMDFTSRDHYRHAVEQLARRSALSEEQVARIALEQAAGGAPARAEREPPMLQVDAKPRHVGYWLIDRGRPALERAIGYHRTWRDALARIAAAAPVAWYLGAILLATLLVVAAAAAGAWRLGIEALVHPALAVALLAMLAGPASQFAVSVVNWLSTLLLRPRPTMRLDFSSGIPQEHRTLVAVPTMLTSARAAESLVDQIELHYLGNQDPNLLLALVTDFPDADQENLPGDAALLTIVREGIERLNRRYRTTGPAVFYLLHRPRKWNPRQGVWMGEERKRGKLAALNRLLRSGDVLAFSVTVGPLAELSSVRYVITLDTDTRLPRDAAVELIGCMAHPLNQPRLDPVTRLVVDGHAILQPRVTTTIPESNRSLFSRLFTGDSAGIDPYTRETSDVYHDAFGQGSFIGKGIYDVYAFEAALEGRFPDNRVLSHDLIEGCFARSGFVNDIELFEGFPSRLLADMSRRHRWIRGDWQIAAWLGPRVPGAAGRLPNPLTGLSLWKIGDNLRRSLVPILLLAFLALGWTAVPTLAAYWTVVALVLVFGPPLVGSLPGLFRKPEEKPWRLHGRDQGNLWIRLVLREALGWCILPYTVHCHLDAIGRTLYRLHISRRGLLQWTTASDAETRTDGNVRDHYEVMWSCVVAALGIAALLAVIDPVALLYAGPGLVAWLVAPAVVWRISQPCDRQAVVLAEDERLRLRRYARQTWHYFDTAVGPEDHWLPPDNVQEHPQWKVVSRTSPTNIGMGLLANLAACDLGYLTPAQLVERTARTFQSMLLLERYRGHFYNWYDTRTLLPAEPRYVSSVDSGNLWGALVVLRAGLLELLDAPPAPQRLWDGLQDTLAVIESLVEGGELKVLLAELRAGCVNVEPDAVAERLVAVCELASRLHATAAVEADSALASWTGALVRQCEAAREYAGPPLPPGEGTEPLASEIHRLADLCQQFAKMDFRFLFHRERKLLAIGFNVTEHRRDNSFYDLLASESRLASFLAVCHGQLPQEHWFTLGRMVTLVDGVPTLLSWSGSMFEYLMPMLLMPTYAGTLLDSSCRAAVRRQIRYGRRRGVPWGISESSYSMTDASFAYRYRAFGVPGLGLDRGLDEHLVVAPYASAMAVMFAPREATANLARLERLGYLSPLGFYDALDYTPERRIAADEPAVCRTVMAHHSGMTLLALVSVLAEQPMQRRLLADPLCRAHDLLLQERVPQAVRPVDPGMLDPGPVTGNGLPAGRSSSRVFDTPHTVVPEVQLLSNGSYHVVLSAAGGGTSRYGMLALTRWHNAPTRDHLGQFVYLRDVATGSFWSNTFQPTRRQADRYQAVFSPGRAEYRVVCEEIDARTQVGVSAEDNVEVRRLALTNLSRLPRTIEVTSYGEVALAAPEADRAHRAWSNMFVETELLPEIQAILCTRRPRSPEEPSTWMFHVLHVQAARKTAVSFETSRERFVGRMQSLERPAALENAGPLSDSQGSVLDPIASIRQTVTLAGDESAVVHAITGVADSRQQAIAAAQRYRDPRLAERVFELASAQCQLTLQHLGMTEADAQLAAELASALLYPHSRWRLSPSPPGRQLRSQNALWPPGIRGDRPIVLVRCSGRREPDLVEPMLKVQAFWRICGLEIDLVFWLASPAGGHQTLNEAVAGIVAASPSAASVDRPGGVFLRRADQHPADDFLALQAAARIDLSDEAGSLEDQVKLARPASSTIVRRPRVPYS